MYEKVNPAHPDKVADRIAGAVVDLAYASNETPRVACEVLVGHGKCDVIIETDADLNIDAINDSIHRIAGDIDCDVRIFPQDKHLNGNQQWGVRCGDNGIFCGCPVSAEQRDLTAIAKNIYQRFGADGKYIIDDDRLIICQSNASDTEILDVIGRGAVVNPLGYWTGGTDVDTGATNRKLGSDMGDAVTGGGLHGKDLSKADVSVNIYAHLKAQIEQRKVELCCAIGDETVDGRPYSEIVGMAREYINARGGFEKFAEWGLIDGT